MANLYERILTGKHKTAKRVGRGISGGGGKTAGRGTKGQRSRTGSNKQIKVWFEGGQTPLHQRLAKKRGFAHRTKKTVAITTGTLNKFFAPGETVTVDALLTKGLVRSSKLTAGVKIIRTVTLQEGIGLGEIATSKSLSSPKKTIDDSNPTTDLV